MWPGTQFRWFDNSRFNLNQSTASDDYRPLFLTAFSADKGTEEMIRIHGSDFYKMYGKSLSFARHGQALLQAGNIIDSGGELLCKRVVAEDATLSNLVLSIELTTITKQDRDKDTDELLYVDHQTGDVTTVAEDTSVVPSVQNEPLMVTSTYIKWKSSSVENCKTFKEVVEVAGNSYVPFADKDVAEYNDSLPAEEQDATITSVKTGTFPLYVITDIGRNKDRKNFRILPKYTASRTLGFMIYTFSEIEGADINESVNITANPYIIYNDKSYAVNENSMEQLKVYNIEANIDLYVEALASSLNMEVDEILHKDFLFGCDVRGNAIDGLYVDASGADIAGDFGLKLASGSDGSAFDFNGTTAFYKSDAYADALEEFFLGEFTEEIFDFDVHKIHACVDCNYPQKVKNAITRLVMHREDFFYFRDLGLGLNDYSAIEEKKQQQIPTKFAGDYMTSYQIQDPYSKRRVEVTMMYDVVRPLVTQFLNSPHSPYAGEINGFTLDNAIRGTLNYTPVITFDTNQKELMDNLRINYAIYYEYTGALTVVSLYTAYEEYSQLSFINNITAVQSVMRGLRTACPLNRYKLMSGNDFSAYQENCEEVLASYRTWFYGLEFMYTEDDILADQKIFYASINFAFNNWIQSEIFDLYAIPTASIDSY